MPLSNQLTDTLSIYLFLQWIVYWQ